MSDSFVKPVEKTEHSEGTGDSMHDIKRELLNSRAQLRQVIDLIPEFIYARDCEGRFLLVNKLAAKYMNHSSETLEGNNYALFETDTDVMERHLDEDRQVIESNESLEIPLEMFTFPDNEVKFVRTVKVPFVTNSTHSKGVLCVSYDITRFITSGRLKDEYISQLEELAFTTSHIVRQPLTSILGIIQLMEYDAISPADLTDILSDLKEQIKNFDSRTRELNDTINTFREKIHAFPG